MVTIKHKKTGEVRNVSRWDWEKALQYTQNRSGWNVVNPGDPVMVMYVYNGGKHYAKYGLMDRDLAEELMKKDRTYYYTEIDLDDSEEISVELPKVITGQKQHDSAPKVSPQYEAKPTSESKHTTWDKIKYIGGVLGAIGTMLTVLQQCAGR